jgi:hypothetical protein
MLEVPIPSRFLAFLPGSTPSHATYKVGMISYDITRVERPGNILDATRTQHGARWCPAGTACRERGWPAWKLFQELQNGLPYRTFPPGHTFDLSDPEVHRKFDAGVSTITIFAPGMPGSDYLTGTVVVGIEVLLPETDVALDEQVPEPPRQKARTSPPVERWQKKPPLDDVKAAAFAVAETVSADDELPTESEWKAKLETQLGKTVTVELAVKALEQFAPQLKRQPGRQKKRTRQIIK